MLAMLALLSWRFMPFRRRRLFYRRGWRSTSIATLILWVLVFLWSFCFLCFVALLPLFCFPEIPLGKFPVPTSLGCFLDAMREGFWFHFQNGLASSVHPLLYQLHYSHPLMNEISMNTNEYLFTATRCCCDKRQG